LNKEDNTQKPSQEEALVPYPGKEQLTK